VKLQYARATAFPSADQEPRLLSLNAFAPHKNKGRKAKAKESVKAMEKRLAKEQAQQQLRNELTQLNVLTSIIPSGCTSYVQVLDVLVNKIIKQYLEEYEDAHYNNNLEEWKDGKFSVGDR
jgi:hypothetical protein